MVRILPLQYIRVDNRFGYQDLTSLITYSQTRNRSEGSLVQSCIKKDSNPRVSFCLFITFINS
ncbi:hypothetical protein V6Z12_A05G258500 [Gossypium hirsutum]